MNRYAFIVNLTAGDGKCRKMWGQVEKLLSTRGVDYTAFFTEHAGHATPLAKVASEQGYNVVVSMGGDGTLNEVVNGIYGQDVTLGLIPAGSGNDFVRSFGYKSGDLEAACNLLLTTQPRKIDVGTVGSKYFINVAGAGFDAEVGHMANVWGKKYFPGYSAYVASILRQLLAFSPQELTIQLDGESISTRAWLVAVANAQFFGAGLQIAPQADVEDRLFDVCIIHATSKLELLRVLPSVFKGQHVNHPAVQIRRAADVSIDGTAALVSQADGEIIGNLPVAFKIAQKQLSVLLPQ
jgi:YegS/Rv2252/BmrU family lipid kinase